MRKTIYKLFWVWDFDKEEKWLNEMAAQGLQLCRVGYCKYVFEAGLPGEYVYRLEMLEHWPQHPQSVQYINFLEDTGAEQIGSLLRWVYFRKKPSGDQGFDLYSDIDSRIRHLNRILMLTGILGGLTLLNGLNNLIHLSHYTLANSVIGLLCLAVALLIGFGFLRLYSKRHKLKKEQFLYE